MYDTHIPLYCAKIFLFFAFIFIASNLSSRIIGWHKLAKRFRTELSPYGETRSVGPWLLTVHTRYGGTFSSGLRMIAASDALYLSLILIYRLAHPPLRIPWEEITLERKRSFFRNFIVIRMGREEQIPFRISERAASKLGLLERMPSSDNA